MTTKNLLLELLAEELPPKALQKLGESFAATLAAQLHASGLVAAATATSFATPRRLAVHVADVRQRAADRALRQKLMPVAVALDAAGQATPALQKKLAALGAEDVAVADLKRGAEGKTEFLYLDSVVAGATLAEGLQAALEAALAALPIPKVMSYQLADGWSTVHFVRPAHRLLALHGADVVPVSVLGLDADRLTQGHRFEAAKPLLSINDADSYEQQMADEGAVIVSFSKRREQVARLLQAAAASEGLQPISDEALLDEVTALTEQPNVLTCQFDEAFLEVPQECLILTMKANQKYFPLLDAAGRLTHKFLVVSNIRPEDATAVIGGNERVVRPRLADARFFLDQDRKKPLAARVAGLDRVVYHNQLGSLGERVARVSALAAALGRRLGDETLARQAEQAAQLAKADLLTDMVGEFPELQGVMGRYYALHDGLPAPVADAIEDHYKPRFAGDELPRTEVGLCVALADKVQTLADMFSIGQTPTGDKDPFALRRHALGVIRMLVERDSPLPLDELLRAAQLTDAAVISSLSDFIYERLSGALREQGYSALEVEAVVSLRPQRLGEIPRRLAAVRAFAALPEAASLAAANKRVRNILKKNADAISPDARPSRELLQLPEEIAVFDCMQAMSGEAEAMLAQGDYSAQLKLAAGLRQPVDAFFEKVMVMADDLQLRRQRLALVAGLYWHMNQVADISRLSS